MFEYEKDYVSMIENHETQPPPKCVPCLSSCPGMEVASYLSNKAASVAMVGTTQYPFERSLGPEIGKMAMHVRTYWFIFMASVLPDCGVFIYNTNSPVFCFFILDVGGK